MEEDFDSLFNWGMLAAVVAPTSLDEFTLGNDCLPLLSSMILSANSTLDMSTLVPFIPWIFLFVLLLSLVELLLLASNCCDSMERSEAFDFVWALRTDHDSSGGGGGDLSNEFSRSRRRDIVDDGGDLSNEFCRLIGGILSKSCCRMVGGGGDLSNELSL